MAGELISEILPLAPDNAALAALLAALPVLFVLYVRCNVGAKKLRPELSLGRLESMELERAVLLYSKVATRRNAIYREREQAGRSWRARYHDRNNFRKNFGEELGELNSYARDLRFTIIRLRARPIQRCKSWIHIHSSQFALGCSLGCYSLILLLLIAHFFYSEPQPWAAEMSTSFETFLLWQGRLLLANWMAASFVAGAMPLLYLVRRTVLYWKHGSQIRHFREFAAADPDRLVEQPAGEAEAEDEPAASRKTAEEEPEALPEAFEERSWFAVLGVTPSASIEDVKRAYKVLVKKNHPDRVYDMSPAFRQLAEAETKRLNRAYAEAMMFLRQENLSVHEVPQAA